MTRPERFDPTAIFASLASHGVEFVLIGGLASGARGAGWPTFDADILILGNEENLERLGRALTDLMAEYDTLHRPPIRPTAERLRTSTGPQLFRTRYGRLDVLKEAGGETYESLLPDSSLIELHSHQLRCASIEALLRMKLAANRPKDAAGIIKLREALRRRESRD